MYGYNNLNQILERKTSINGYDNSNQTLDRNICGKEGRTRISLRKSYFKRETRIMMLDRDLSRYGVCDSIDVVSDRFGDSPRFELSCQARLDK